MADNSTDDMIIAIGVDVATIRRGLKKLEQEVASSTGKVQKQFETVGRGIDSAMTSAMQNRINAMVGIGTKGAKEWTGALADQGKELERLRAKYSPLFATINSYKASQADIRRAHALGAISVDEMTTALSRERQEALKSIATIKARNAALSDTPNVRGGSGFQTSNIAAQFQDIAVTSAMGMSPLQIALQQGTQLSAVFNDLKRDGQSVVGSLAGAFTSLISPVSLVTIGLVAGGAALIQYISSASSVKTADDAIKSHADTIASIKDAYGAAAEGLGDYVKKSQAEAAAAARENLKVQQDVAKAATAEFNKLMGVLQARTGGASDVATRFRPFTDAIRDFRKSVADGAPDFVRLRSQIEAIVATDPQGLRKLADELINGSVVAADADRRVRSAKDVIDGLGKIALDQTSGIGSLTDALKELADIAVPALTDAERALAAYRKAVDSAQGAEERRAAAKAYDDARRRIDDANPTINNADGKRVGVPTPGDKPSALDGDGKELRKAETAAQKAANAYRDLIKSADDRIGQLRLETELTGQYGVATDAARFRLELLQQAEDKGRSLSPTQRAEIEQKVALYEKYSQALSETKLQQDLLNAARFNSLSQTDQKVVSTLRQYGLPEDLGGKNAQSIRQSLQSEEIKDSVSSFLGDFKSALLENGGDIGDAFGKALLNSLMKSMDKQWEAIFNLIGSGIASSLTSKGGIAGTAAASVASTFAAPVGAVSRSVLPAALPTGDIASYITQAAIKRGIDPAIALKVAKSEGGLDSWNLQSNFVKNGVREPSYGPYQLYMGGGLGNAFQKQTGLDPRLAANGPAGVDFALDNAKKSGWGAWYGAAKVGVGNWDGIGKGANTATAALEKMAAASTETTKGLGGLANSLASGLGGAGGGFDWGSLFSSSFKPNTTLSNFLSGIPGFDGGGNTGMGARSGGLDGKGGFLALMHPRETVTDHTKINAPRAPRLAAANSNRMVRNETSLTVQIQGASGDDHVRMLVNQGVQTALRDQNEHMRRQGFGNIQQAYTTDRG